MNRRGACALLLGALLLAAIVPVLAAVDTQIDVSRSGELYLVDAVMVVPFSPREAWDVLTDFDAMARFVPNLEVSRVTSRSGDRLQVEQRGVARWGPLSQTFTTVREIELQPIDEVRSKSIGGSLRQVSSVTRFAAAAGGTEIRHHVEFAMDTWMPSFLARPFLQHEVREQFDAVVGEMLRRRVDGRR
jgi:ribosome-associated toxin RatA of RatAB toxin-antitoxin module